MLHEKYIYQSIMDRTSALLLSFLAAIVFEISESRDFPTILPDKRAICIFNQECGDLSGYIHFFQDSPHLPVVLKGHVNGLSPGLHGFHVHIYGDLSNGCLSAGPHFNPFNVNHGGPKSRIRHVGDLGNISANKNGIALVDIMDSHISLTGPLSILGRSIVVHAQEDDLGKGGNAESLKTGNSGKRVGCCIIGRQQEPPDADIRRR